MNFRIGEAIEVLRTTPKVIGDLFSDISPAWITANEGADTWTARDVLAHLAELERSDWPVRLRVLMKDGEHGTFASVDRTRFQATLADETIPQLVRMFKTQREANLVELEALAITEGDLARRTNHPAFGSVTLQQFLAAWTVHDLTHLAQIVRVMAKRYSDDVGPWKQYLSVLR